MSSQILKRQQMKLVIYGAWICDMSANETYNKLKEKGVSKLPSRGSIHRWFKLFKRKDVSFGDKPRSGRPKSATNESSIMAVQKCILEDKTRSIMKISTATGLSKSTVGKILKDELGMKKTPKSKVWKPAKRDKIGESSVNVETDEKITSDQSYFSLV